MIYTNREIWGEKLNLIKQTEAISAIITIILIIISMIIGGLLSYLWVMSNFYNMPTGTLLSVENVHFPSDNYTYFTLDVLNPSNSLTNVNITSFQLTSLATNETRIIDTVENTTENTTYPTETVLTISVTPTQQPRQLTPLEVLRERSKEAGENVTTEPSPVARDTTQVATQALVQASPVPTPAFAPDTTQTIAMQATTTGNPFLDRVMEFIEKLLNLFE